MTNISILVAVYNGERYLRQCLDSILEQTMKDLQVICVDDASTDHSLDILREYAAKDSRVQVLSLEANVGVAAARNRGLRLATGKYVCFVDCDDWIAPNAMQEICEVFSSHPQTDCVLFDLYLSDERGSWPYPMRAFEVMTGKEAFEKSLAWEIHGVYAVRTSLHKAYPYEMTAHVYSDENATRVHYLRSREVRTSRAKYYYRQHLQSITHAISVSRFDILLANQWLKLFLLKEDVGHDVLRQHENLTWLNIIGMYKLYYHHRKHFSSKECHHALSLVKQAWANIEPRLLRRSIKWKFGYIPFHHSWFLFRLQEEMYFTLRHILRR